MALVTCPNGHRFRRPRVVFGLPTPEAMAEAEEGKLILGGCDPTFPVPIECPDCGEIAEWASDWASGAPPEAVSEGSGRPRPRTF